MVKALSAGHEELRPAEVAAKSEKPAPAAASPAKVTALEQRADFDRVCLGGCFLSAVSGMVNAVAIFELSSTVAHHTGNASHFGRFLGADGFRFFVLLVAYMVGAGAAGYGGCDGDAVFSGRRSDGLLGSAGAVAIGVLLQLIGLSSLALPLLAFSQGLQNGVTSRFTGLALRTTHMTGALTDAGLILGQWAKAQQDGKQGPSLRKPILFGSCILSFAAGGFAASIVRKFVGILAALVPAALLAAAASGKAEEVLAGTGKAKGA